MISDTDVKTIINAALKKDFPLSSERLLLLVNSDLSTYELLDIVCDFINSLGTISKGKDAELLCKLKAKNMANPPLDEYHKVENWPNLKLI